MCDWRWYLVTNIIWNIRSILTKDFQASYYMITLREPPSGKPTITSAHNSSRFFFSCFFFFFFFSFWINDYIRPQQQQVFFRFFGFYFFSFPFPPFLNQRSPPITPAAGSFFSFLISFLLDPSLIIAFSCQSVTKSVRALVEFCSNWICRICYMEFSRFWFVKIDQWISLICSMDLSKLIHGFF